MKILLPNSTPDNPWLFEATSLSFFSFFNGKLLLCFSNSDWLFLFTSWKTQTEFYVKKSALSTQSNKRILQNKMFLMSFSVFSSFRSLKIDLLENPTRVKITEMSFAVSSCWQRKQSSGIVTTDGAALWPVCESEFVPLLSLFLLEAILCYC